MKYKKMVARLATAQRVWDALSQKDKATTTRPGSVKHR